MGQAYLYAIANARRELRGIEGDEGRGRAADWRTMLSAEGRRVDKVQRRIETLRGWEGEEHVHQEPRQHYRYKEQPHELRHERGRKWATLQRTAARTATSTPTIAHL